MNKEFAAYTLNTFSNLAQHVCVNKKGETFGADIVGTELPHLFEHLTIELLAQKHPEQAKNAEFSGYTIWLQAPRGANKVSFRTRACKPVQRLLSLISRSAIYERLHKKEVENNRAFMMVTITCKSHDDCLQAAKTAVKFINEFLLEKK